MGARPRSDAGRGVTRPHWSAPKARRGHEERGVICCGFLSKGQNSVAKSTVGVGGFAHRPEVIGAPLNAVPTDVVPVWAVPNAGVFAAGFAERAKFLNEINGWGWRFRAQRIVGQRLAIAE